MLVTDAALELDKCNVFYRCGIYYARKLKIVSHNREPVDNNKYSVFDSKYCAGLSSVHTRHVSALQSAKWPPSPGDRNAVTTATAALELQTKISQSQIRYLLGPSPG